MNDGKNMKTSESKKKSIFERKKNNKTFQLNSQSQSTDTHKQPYTIRFVPKFCYIQKHTRNPFNFTETNNENATN